MGTSSQDTQFTPGQSVTERYEIIEHIGTGGNGTVLHVRDKLLQDDNVALKILSSFLAQDIIASGRFRNELMVSRKLSHPNVLKLYDLGKSLDGTSYISMEYVKGESLTSRLRRHKEEPLQFEDILYLLFQLTNALAFAHAHGVIHRDIKPENILLTGDGQIKLADFGVARSQEFQNGFTQTGEGIGTPVYMAPEQVNAKYVDHRADIYSVGIIAYELIAGEPPFIGNNWMMLIAKHMNEPMPSLIEKGFSVPGWYDEWIQKATAKKPEDRFSSVCEIRDLIVQHLPLEKLPDETVVKVSSAETSSEKSPFPYVLSASVGLVVGALIVMLL